MDAKHTIPFDMARIFDVVPLGDGEFKIVTTPLPYDACSIFDVIKRSADRAGMTMEEVRAAARLL